MVLTPPKKKVIHLLTIQPSRRVGVLGCKFVVFDCITYFCTILSLIFYPKLVAICCMRASYDQK